MQPNRFSQPQLTGNIPNSSYTPQEKAQCVTWYNENGSITTVRRKFLTGYQRTEPSRNLILNWLRNFELRGNMENRNAYGRPSMTPQTIETCRSYRMMPHFRAR